MPKKTYLVKAVEIGTLVKAKKSLKEISQILDIPYSTVRRIAKKYASSSCVNRKKGSGRPKILAPDELAIIEEKIAADPKKNCTILANEMLLERGVSVSAETMRRALHGLKLVSAVPAKKPFLSSSSKSRRLSIAESWILRPFAYNERIIFSDESRFTIFQSDGRFKIWREEKKRYDAKNCVPTVKFGGGSVMVWGCIGYNGVGNLEIIDGIMDSIKYIRVLSTNLFKSARLLHLGADFVFQQDNAPCHTSRFTKKFFSENEVKLMDWPTQSPDLNPIENVWSYMGLQLRKCDIKTKSDLTKNIKKIWENIPKEYIKNLFDSIPKRLELVIKKKGGPIPY
jgi:transposase